MGLDFTPELLIVDDRIENLELLRALLGKMDVKLELIQSPLEALQKVEKKEYALIILDIQMPQMDGFLLAQKIREGRMNIATPIIFLTAFYLDKESEQRGYDVGCVDFIMKPFNSTILTNKINIFLDLYKNKKEKEIQNQELNVALRDKELFENKLRNLASNYRTILEGQSELILRINSSQVIEFANKAFSDFFDYSLDGISKNSISDISRELSDQFKMTIEQMNGKKQSMIVEQPLKNQLSELKWIEWTIFKQVDFDDIHYLIIGRDVSQRKLIRDSLLKKEKIMRKTEKLTKLGSFEWDSYSKILKGSEGFYKLYEVLDNELTPVEEMLKMKVHPDDLHAIDRMLYHLPKKSQKLEFEHRIILSNSSIKHIRVKLYTEYDPVSDILHLHGLVSNISKEKILDATFRESLSLDKNAYRDKVFLELNEKNEINYINDFGCAFLECNDVQKTKGINFLNFIPEADQLKVGKILDQKRRKKDFVFEVITIQTKSEKLKKVVFGAYSIRNNNEVSIRAILHCLSQGDLPKQNKKLNQDDLLGLKRKENEFSKNTEKLMERVNQELKVNEFQRQLLSKKSELESLGKMAGSVVHEINQPLTGISMIMDNILLRLSMDKIDEEYIREKCSQVFHDIDRIKKYLSQIGIFNSAQKENTIDSVDVNHVVKDAIDLIRKQYKNSKIDIKLKVNPESLYICGNRYKLQKVIVDILNNSYESIGEKLTKGKKTNDYITIKTELINEEVVVVIKDNGHGIDPDNLNYIFEPFFSTKQNGIGSGLGLYVSKDIVQKMNGKIAVKSKKDEYTEMKLIFPFEIKTEKKEVYFKEN